MILYIGNKLSKHGYTQTGVETCGIRLRELYDVVTVSDKRNKILRLADMMLSVIRYRKKADYILIDTYSTSNFYYALLAALLCRMLRKKYIPILHGGGLPSRLDRSAKLSRAIFSYSYMNVSPSEYLNHEFRIRNFNRLITIPNAVDIGKYKFMLRHAFAPKLLWVRSFDKTYNCEMAVKVLHALLQDYPQQAELCMVGPDKDGSLAQVQALAEELGVSGKLKITGKLSLAEWTALSSKYDIFINTTNTDNMPVSVIEAMALGLAVVSTDVGGIPYLVKAGHEALLVAKNDTENMVRQIKNIIQNPEKSALMCEHARRKVEAFDWESIKQQWKKLLV